MKLAQLIADRGGDDTHIATAADGEFLRETNRAHGIVEEAACGDRVLVAKTPERENSEYSKQNDDGYQFDQRKSGFMILFYYNHVNQIK